MGKGIKHEDGSISFINDYASGSVFQIEAVTSHHPDFVVRLRVDQNVASQIKLDDYVTTRGDENTFRIIGKYHRSKTLFNAVLVYDDLRHRARVLQFVEKELEIKWSPCK